MKIYLNSIKVSQSVFDFIIEVNPKLNEFEQEVLVQIINTFIKKRDKHISLSVNRLKTILKVKDTDIIYETLSSLIKKEIILSCYSNDRDWSKLNISILSSFELIRDYTCNVTLSSEFLKAFKSNSIYYQMNLDMLIRFRNRYSPIFYRELILKLEEENMVEVKTETLKEIFAVGDKYARVFDFERKVIRESIDEINRVTPYTLVYDKVYKGKKVEAFVFILKEVDKSKIYDSSQIREEKDEYSIIFEEFSNYSSLFAIESVIYSKLAELKFSYNTYSNLSDALAQLEKEKIIVFEYNDIRLLVEYNKEEKSLIRIYQRVK